MAKIVVTGSKGKIGSVLSVGLAGEHEVVGLDVPEVDISDYEALLQNLAGADMLIHAAFIGDPAYPGKPEDAPIDPRNVTLDMNVFTAAREAGIKRLIISSSVQADDFESYDGSELLTIPGSHQHASPYGAHKIIIEQTARFYAQHCGLECVAIRFGGVTRDDVVKSYDKEPAVWLSHNDLLGAVSAAVNAPTVLGGFSVFYAVSNNTGKLHSTDNSFGWQPVDNSADHIEKSL